MFKKNEKHKQADLFGLSSSLPAAYVEEIEESAEKSFYKLIYSNIREKDFAYLYSEEFSYLNSAVDYIVGGILLQASRNWTRDELYSNIKCNLLTNVALGLQPIHEVPFSRAKFFYTQNRLNDHCIKTGVNLLEKQFDHLT